MGLKPHLPRRAVLVGASTLAAVGCGRRREADGGTPTAQPAGSAPRRGSLEWAVAGRWRGEDGARDRWRHPLETLRFFGLQPGMTVVEFWPGAGWYTQILAPYLKETGGKLYAASFQPSGQGRSAAAEVAEAYRMMFGGDRGLYGEIDFTTFGPTSLPPTPPGAADLALFLQTLHSWMAAGLAEKAFRDAFVSLKPGGALGVEAHRADPGGLQDPLASDGYIQEAYVQKLAEEAGFILDQASDINANPADSKDHPFGVWTLPPERRTSAIGSPVDPAFDRTRYDAIGESDRMTLRFVKPT